MLHPSAKQSRARGGNSLIKHAEKRALLFLRAHSSGKLKVTSCIYIHLKILSLLIDAQILDVGYILLLSFLNVGKKRAESRNERSVFKIIVLYRISELLFYSLKRFVVIKLRRAIVVKKRAESRMDKVGKITELAFAKVQHHLCRRVGAKLVAKLRSNVIAAEEGSEHLCRRNVGKRHATFKLAHIYRAEIVALALGEQIALYKRTRSYHSDDLAAHESLCKSGIFGLLADSYLISS